MSLSKPFPRCAAAFTVLLTPQLTWFPCDQHGRRFWCSRLHHPTTCSVNNLDFPLNTFYTQIHSKKLQAELIVRTVELMNVFHSTPCDRSGIAILSRHVNDLYHFQVQHEHKHHCCQKTLEWQKQWCRQFSTAATLPFPPSILSPHIGLPSPSRFHAKIDVEL